MRVLQPVLLIALAAAPTNSQQASPPPSAPPPVPVVPATCPVTTRPERPFIPPAEYRNGEELPKNSFWIGTNELWTGIWENQYWYWKPHEPGHEHDLTQKIFWFRETYNWHKEPIPKLRVTGKRIDGPSPPLMNPQGPATNAIIDNNHGAMLTGVYLPAPGCWEITGDYEGTKLSFVVWVVAEPGADQDVPGTAKNTEGR